MPFKGPHISIPLERLVSRVLNIHPDEFKDWPESVQELAVDLAGELFLVLYNPFVNPEVVRKSVDRRFASDKPSLSSELRRALTEGIEIFWKDYDEDKQYQEEVIRRLGQVLPKESIVTSPNVLVECSTDATDLRMMLPMMVLMPTSAEQVREIIRLAGELDFGVIPRGGGSGLTGGAIPSRKRSVILSLSRLKEITEIDVDNRVLCAQSGVITLDLINAADEMGLLFTVDPASKAASSLGGNISENSGGPFAFEYGTTIDNIFSYRMVTPTAEIIEVKRKNHPGHKILPHETAVFEIFDEAGNLKDTVSLTGEEIRSPGLGKDVTNKYLGGLPGVQKEGVDGVITDCCFQAYPKLAHSRTLCLEFFGSSMRNAMMVIKDMVALRDRIRKQGDLVKMSALEEFGIKYVQAIEYKKKSDKYEGDPISVLIMQLDSDDEHALEEAVQTLIDIVEPYENVDIFKALDQKQAEIFWEDRHKLSAITKRTSGFKINEDIVIPIDVIPEFSDFIEELNLYYLAVAYRKALRKIGDFEGIPLGEKSLDQEMILTFDILRGKITPEKMSEQELETRIRYFFQDIRSRYPKLHEEITIIFDELVNTRVVIANHMHAGDGNCHVNIPVNSNNPEMLHLAEEAADKVFKRVLKLKGEVTGEHGIGITKIAYLAEDKMAALKTYKDKVDPQNILNPGKLTQRKLPVEPYTFSFNRLIQDLRKTDLADKHRLIGLLSGIQTCSRCGKCKQVCPMYAPQQGIMFHPRNKNISLGALIEAIYYSQVQTGRPDKKLLDHLRNLMEHCTACGKCTGVCPVKINTSSVTLDIRAFLEDKGAGGHPLKTKILGYLASDPQKRLPRAAKVLAVGQEIQRKTVGLIPTKWRQRAQNPLLQGPGPHIDFKSLASSLSLSRGSFFIPNNGTRDMTDKPVFYFPGCGAGLFYRSIGQAALFLLLRNGIPVIMPDDHLCCGYPLLVSGCEEAFLKNRERNQTKMAELIESATRYGVKPGHILTACGSCREGLKDYDLDTDLAHMDVAQYIIEQAPPDAKTSSGEKLIYHPSCHAEWSGVPPAKSGDIYAAAISDLTHRPVRQSPGCCGESGLGALTSPTIYNKLRKRKKEQLIKDLDGYPEDRPILVGCPSCKIGISRNLIDLHKKQPVLHSLEYLAEQVGGKNWRKRLLKALPNGKNHGPRVVQMDDLK